MWRWFKKKPLEKEVKRYCNDCKWSGDSEDRVRDVRCYAGALHPFFIQVDKTYKGVPEKCRINRDLYKSLFGKDNVDTESDYYCTPNKDFQCPLYWPRHSQPSKKVLETILESLVLQYKL